MAFNALFTGMDSRYLLMKQKNHFEWGLWLIRFIGAIVGIACAGYLLLVAEQRDLARASSMSRARGIPSIVLGVAGLCVFVPMLVLQIWSVVRQGRSKSRPQ